MGVSREMSVSLQKDLLNEVVSNVTKAHCPCARASHDIIPTIYALYDKRESFMRLISI